MFFKSFPFVLARYCAQMVVVTRDRLLSSSFATFLRAFRRSTGNLMPFDTEFALVSVFIL